MPYRRLHDLPQARIRRCIERRENLLQQGFGAERLVVLCGGNGAVS